MPHVIVKLWPGKSEAQKRRLATKIAQDVMDAFPYLESMIRTRARAATVKISLH